MTATSSKHTAGPALRLTRQVLEAAARAALECNGYLYDGKSVLACAESRDPSVFNPRAAKAVQDARKIISAANEATKPHTGLTPRQLAERCKELEVILKEVHAQFECPVRNTNRGRAYREGVTISSDLRESVRAALSKAQKGGV